MWAYESVFYQIYPMGFAGAPFENDGVQRHGILKVIDWIPHIKNIGCNAVYFSPVFESDTHGYNTRDYKKIDCRLGTNEDFLSVCRALHDTGIKIVLDGVFNHVGRGHFAFQDVLRNRENSRYLYWFNINLGGNNGYNDGLWYEGWEGNYDLVKLNLRNEEAISEKYTSEMQPTMDVFFCKLSECRKITADHFATQGADAISDAKVMGVLLIISVCLFAGLVIYTYVFLHRRVSAPIKDVYEWAMGFEKGYGDMNDLTWEKDDEIGKIKHAFNTVKKKLNYANALSEEYASAMKKLKSEEEIKEKFVKQLYDEKRDKEAISTAAKRDGLTGLYNRRTFDDVVNDYLRRRVNGAEAALFLIDMDNFKNVNDTLGHLAGDDALKMLAGAMRIALPEAHLGRYGGDEFIALFTDYNTVDDVKAAADTLCRKMRVDFSNAGKTVKLSVSIGIATTEGVSGYSELYMKADRALYFAKENGRDQFKLESELKDSDIAE